MAEALKLTAYVGERDRTADALLADALMDVFDAHGLRTSALLRGTEGFGVKHRLQTQSLLTLSEDLPIVALAVDEAPRIEAALADVRSACSGGLVTVERAQIVEQGRYGGGAAVDAGEELKLTVYVGRGARVGSRPAYVAVVDALHSSGLAGASVLLGLDGHVGGVRRRATFLGSNAEVPLMVLSVGSGESVVWALALLEAMDCETTVTLERVRVCRRDGVAVGEPHGDPSAGAEAWQKLTVYASEQSTHAGQPLQATLVRRLRREGAAGATVLRGIWGYHGDHEPHGERFWSLRRHVPSIAVVLDTAANMGRWFEIVAELTGETGLVTSEVVPWHLDGTDSAGNVA